VHDWFQGFHGAERVVDALHADIFAQSPDIFTFHAARELLPPDLANAIVKESRVAALPFIRQQSHDPGLWRLLLPWMPRYFAGLDLDAYDVVISSSHAFATNVRTSPDTIHVSYCHTPIRYVWLPMTDSERATGITGLGLRLLRGYFRRVDLDASRRPDLYVANSTAVRDRIREVYKRDAVVIHPPVDVDEFAIAQEKEHDHFVWVHRLVSYKRPELVAEAFRDLPYRLTMVGVGPLEERLRRDLPPNVQLRGWMPRTELARLVASAAGFIHIAEEDFGISMVEALAAGTPVIALARGGARDIVTSRDLGVLIQEATIEQLRAALRTVAARNWEGPLLAQSASRFSRSTFAHQMRDLLANQIHSRPSRRDHDWPQ
jgi:glycosyltransferase involved in cell wall biosynthesis